MAANEIYVPGEVYKNLCTMLVNYRGAKITSKIYTPEELLKQMNIAEYAVVKAVWKGNPLIAVVFKPDSKYITKSPEFSKMMSGVLDSNLAKSTIIIVSEEKVSTHINKILLKYWESGAYVEDILYRILIIESPKHVSVPKHEITSQEEIDAVLERFHIDKDGLAKIDIKDPQVIWIGGREGDVIKITAASKTAAIAIEYNYVVRRG